MGTDKSYFIADTERLITPGKFIIVYTENNKPASIEIGYNQIIKLRDLSPPAFLQLFLRGMRNTDKETFYAALRKFSETRSIPLGKFKYKVNKKRYHKNLSYTVALQQLLCNKDQTCTPLPAIQGRFNQIGIDSNVYEDDPLIIFDGTAVISHSNLTALVNKTMSSIIKLNKHTSLTWNDKAVIDSYMPI